MKEILDDIKAKNQTRLLLKVKAGAKQNSIDGWMVIDNKDYLRLSIKSPPAKGKANKLIVEYLAKELGIARSCIEITSGKTSPFKVVTLELFK